jgi:hypothetical protein
MSAFVDILITPAVVIALAGSIAAMFRFLYIKYREHQSINRAMLSEISRLLMVIDRHAKWWKESMNAKETDLPFIDFSTDIYTMLLEKWNEVDSSYVASATKFYGYIQFLNRLHKARKNYPPKKRHLFNETYLNSLQAILRDYGTSFNTAFEIFGVDPPKLYFDYN